MHLETATGHCVPLELELLCADVHDLDNGGEAGSGHLPAAAGDGFPWKPTNILKLEPTIFWLSVQCAVGSVQFSVCSVKGTVYSV